MLSLVIKKLVILNSTSMFYATCIHIDVVHRRKSDINQLTFQFSGALKNTYQLRLNCFKNLFLARYNFSQFISNLINTAILESFLSGLNLEDRLRENARSARTSFLPLKKASALDLRLFPIRSVLNKMPQNSRNEKTQTRFLTTQKATLPHILPRTHEYL